MGWQYYTQDMSKIPLKYHKKCCFTQSIHTLRLSVGGRTDGRTDGRTHGRTDARKIFTQYSGISSCSLGSTDFRARLICSGIRRNLEFRPEIRREGPLSTAFYATCNKHSACGLNQHKSRCQQCYTVLPPLLPLLAISVAIAVAVAVAVATVSFAAVFSWLLFDFCCCHHRRCHRHLRHHSRRCRHRTTSQNCRPSHLRIRSYVGT